MIKKYLTEHKSFLWFSGFLVIGCFYFLSKLLPFEYHTLHFSLDDKIPFLPAFIIPYILWYLYVPGLMIFVYFKDENAFKKQALAFFSGAIFCELIFLLFPTIIDFRPTAEGDGILLWLTRIIYANDTPPANCFPSLHCFEALSVHLTTFTVGPLKNSIPLRVCSFVLVAFICVSTVFVKQHSFIDIIGGCLVAVISCIIVNKATVKKEKKDEPQYETV